MSEEKTKKQPTWLAKEFPTEWYFTEKFVDKLFNIMGKMPSETYLNFVKISSYSPSLSKKMTRKENLQPGSKLIQIS